MQKAILILLAFFVATNNVANGFVLDSIDMTNSTFEQLSSGSDRAVSEIVADALREYMTQNEIKILLDQSNSYKNFILFYSKTHLNQVLYIHRLIYYFLFLGDVKVQQRFPDESIHTGHSCSKTARTMGTVATAWMIPSTAQLGPEGVISDGTDKMAVAIAASDIDHQVQVDMSIRVEFGAKIFRKCKRVGRKTCRGIKGHSRGKSNMLLKNVFLSLLKNILIKYNDIDVVNTLYSLM